MTGGAELALLLVAAIGVAGTVLPAIPGVALIVIAALVYAWYTSFAVLGWTDLIVLTGLAVISYGADFVLGLGGARRFGASRPGMVGAMLGLLFGLMVFGPLGIVIGPVLGAAAGELLYGRHPKAAIRAGIGAGIGTLLATVFRLVIAVICFLFLVWQVVFHR